MFARLGDWIVRNYKAIIAVWMVIMVASVPLMTMVGSVTVYEETAMAPENIESAKADDIIAEQFPMGLANSTAMVVIQSPDVTSEEVKNFTSELEDELRANQEIEFFEDYTSIYTAYEGIIGSTVTSSAPAIHQMGISNFSAFSGITDISFLESMYLLGPAPSQENVAAFAHSVAENGTLATYPVPMPGELRSGFISPDNDTMIVLVAFSRSVGFGMGKEGEDNIDIIRAEISDLKEDMGMQALVTYVSGDAAISSDMARAAGSDIERIDPITVALVIILLGVFFLSVVTPVVPLVIIGVAIVVSQALIFLVGYFIASIHYSAITMLVPLLLAIGVDYSIFIVARYREERAAGRSKEDSVRTSVTWAGESIATSGGVVMISFGSLSVAGFGMLKTMGLVFMLGIGVALLAALTFLPSVLMLLGDRIFWPSKAVRKKDWLASGDKGAEAKEAQKRGEGTRNGGKKNGYFEGAARFSLKHAKAIVIAALLVSIPTTYLVLNLHSSYDFIASMPDAESKQGLNAMAEGFGKGNIMPTYIVVQAEDEIFDGSTFDTAVLNSVDNLTARTAALGNVKSVEPSTNLMGARIDLMTWQGFSDEDRASMVHGAIGNDNRTVMIKVVFEEEPFSSASMSTVSEIRAEVADFKGEPGEALGGSQILVGGATAGMRDIQESMNNDFRNMAIIVIIGIFVLLLIVLGSVLIPLRLIITISLSISWALAMTMILFEWFKGIPVLWMMPMILFILLMGLGMDYDIFLVTRIREEVSKGKSDEDAIVTAVERTGGIITACGVIMAGALASLMLSSMGLIQEFGFGLSFAIIIDATIVRIYLVPAIMILLKRWNWWAPGRLQRVRREEKEARRTVKKDGKAAPSPSPKRGSGKRGDSADRQRDGERPASKPK